MESPMEALPESYYALQQGLIVGLTEPVFQQHLTEQMDQLIDRTRTDHISFAEAAKRILSEMGPHEPFHKKAMLSMAAYHLDHPMTMATGWVDRALVLGRNVPQAITMTNGQGYTALTWVTPILMKLFLFTKVQMPPKEGLDNGYWQLQNQLYTDAHGTDDSPAIS